MKNKFFLFIIGVCLAAGMYGQERLPDSLMTLFGNQLAVFPQEKIYVHTDKPYYISGEHIWFRAYLTDASTHIPAPASRYVYVELIDPVNLVIARVKVQQDKGAYHGRLLIPDDAPEGDYTLRAYTAYMQNQAEDYFWSKTVRIGDPQSRSFHAEADFSFSPNTPERVDVTFRFSRIIPAGSLEPFVPPFARISVNSGKPINIKIDDDGAAAIHFNLPVASRERLILLELETARNPYRKYIRIPTPDDDFDVSFYPEGGSLMQGVSCKLAFKALKSNGQATHISGALYDQAGNEIRAIKSDYLGMGVFPHIAEKGMTYYIVCENDKGQTKRFDLPAPAERGYALSVSRTRGNIHISVLKPSGTKADEQLYLLAHTRGIVHFADLWDQERNLAVIGNDQLPSGVLHLILFDAGRNPVSERLLFINNNDQAAVAYQPDRERFATRSLVKNRVTVTDSDGEPVTGSFSVSVTSDKEVSADSTSGILAQMLLTSDLRGMIENPAYYFQNNAASAYSLDLLMLTQGWRRYNIAGLAKGQLAKPVTPIEKSVKIAGTVKSLFQSKPVEGIDVTVLSQNLKEVFVGSTKTDKEGRFFMDIGNFPDSAQFIVNAEPKRSANRLELFMDSENFPARTLTAVPTAEVDKYLFAKYADKAEQQFIIEGGVRTYFLNEVVIIAPKPPRQSTYYATANNSITREELKEYSIPNISTLLMRIPGVLISPANRVEWVEANEGQKEMTDEEKEQLTEGQKYEIQVATQAKADQRRSTEAEQNTSGISIRGRGKPLLMIDDVIVEYETIADIETMINVHEIDQIDILKDPTTTSIFGVRGSNGVIVVFTKVGERTKYEQVKYNAKSIMPLGYQPPVEFYAPKYDTPERRNTPGVDLRTTIHWQPIVQTDANGIASFEFYTADDPASYSVTIEGLTKDGKIISQKDRLWKENIR